MAVPRTLAPLILTASFIATACSASGGSLGGSPSAAGQGLPSGGAGAVAIGAGSSRSLGTLLAGPRGRRSERVALHGHVCHSAAPPHGRGRRQPTAGAGVTGKLRTLTRADGTT